MSIKSLLAGVLFSKKEQEKQEVEQFSKALTRNATYKHLEDVTTFFEKLETQEYDYSTNDYDFFDYENVYATIYTRINDTFIQYNKFTKLNKLTVLNSKTGEKVAEFRVTINSANKNRNKLELGYFALKENETYVETEVLTSVPAVNHVFSKLNSISVSMYYDKKCFLPNEMVKNKQTSIALQLGLQS